MTALRTITGKVTTQQTETRFSNVQVLVAADALPVDCRVRVARLKCVPSLLKHASPVHLRLGFHQISSSTSWVSMLVKDLLWMWNSIPTLYETFPSPSSDLAFWLNLCFVIVLRGEVLLVKLFE